MKNTLIKILAVLGFLAGVLFASIAPKVYFIILLLLTGCALVWVMVDDLLQRGL